MHGSLQGFNEHTHTGLCYRGRRGIGLAFNQIDKATTAHTGNLHYHGWVFVEQEIRNHTDRYQRVRIVTHEGTVDRQSVDARDFHLFVGHTAAQAT
ncbi:hypothetical protein D3C72_1778680 [compost metagenome]